MDIEELDLSVRAYNCLKRAGIDTVEQLKKLTDDELARIRNISKRCIEEIRQKVGAPGMTNADHIRAMGDEELVELLLSRLNTDAEQIPFCKGSTECETLLGTEAGIPAEKCGACMLRWLQEPWEGR